MEGEISNFVMVWTAAALTMSYCHAIGGLVPRGSARLAAVLPAVAILLLLPLRLTSIHLGGPTCFFLGWLSTFKILLFAFGKGPLASDRRLSLLRFVPLALLPIKLQPPLNHNKTVNSSSQKNIRRSTFEYAYCAMAAVMALLIPLYGKKESLHPKFVMFLYILHMYIGLEFIFFVTSFFTRKLLRIELELQFDKPYLSTSLQEFWGRRWNIMVNRILHPAVYEPVARAATCLLGRKWAPLPAILATFFVSGVMHELVFYYISRGWEAWELSWDAMCFFLLHGACLALEVAIKKEIKGKKHWQVPRVLTRMMTVVFVIYTALSLFVPALVRCCIYEKATRELFAVAEFGKELYACL